MLLPSIIFKRAESRILNVLKRHMNDLNTVREVKWSTYTTQIMPHYSIQIAEAVNTDLIFEDAIEYDLPEPFGVVTWDSSNLAADILHTKFGLDKNRLRNKVVCDLGCGTGLAGLFCLELGAEVISLDLNELSLDLCRKSHAVMCSDKPQFIDMHRTQLFDMGDFKNPLPHCDVLIISDLLYYDSLATMAARRVHEALTVNPLCIVLVTDPGRLAAETFLKELRVLLMNTLYEEQLCFLRYLNEECTGSETNGNYLYIQRNKNIY